MIAFELSNASLVSFEASAAYNGFKKAITLHKVRDLQVFKYAHLAGLFWGHRHIMKTQMFTSLLAEVHFYAVNRLINLESLRDRQCF